MTDCLTHALTCSRDGNGELLLHAERPTSMNLRCLNPQCRRFLCEADITSAADLRLPCSQCGGNSIYRFDHTGILYSRSHVQRKPAPDRGLTRADIHDRRENRPPSRTVPTPADSRKSPSARERIEVE